MVTFAAAAEAVLRKKADELTNEKYRRMWIRSLTKLVPARRQHKPVADWTIEDVLLCLQPIWTKTLAPAVALGTCIEATLDWAISQGHRSDNPASWRRLRAILPNPTKIRTVKHHAAVRVSDAAAAFAALGDDTAGQCQKMIAACVTCVGSPLAEAITPPD